MTTVHKNLTGADLHEPKGVDTATSGKVYVSDGAGSGSWVAASSIVTNTAFSTGDLKPTHKSTADSGWIIWTTGTIGDGSSGATIRANADTASLYALYWTLNYSTISISGGRGGSASSDFAAHKTLYLPPSNGRALVISGYIPPLTSRALTEGAGTETNSVTLVANQIPSLVSVNASQAISVTSTSSTILSSNTLDNYTSSAGSAGYVQNVTHGAVTSTGTNSISTTYTNSSLQPVVVATVPPSTFINVMIKL